jgi:hypothetical protein
MLVLSGSLIYMGFIKLDPMMMGRFLPTVIFKKIIRNFIIT